MERGHEERDGSARVGGDLAPADGRSTGAAMAGPVAARLLHLQRSAGNRAVTATVQRRPPRPPAHGREWELDNNHFIDLARRAIRQSYGAWLPREVPNILTDPSRAAFHLMGRDEFLQHIGPQAQRDRVDPEAVQGHEDRGQVFVRANPGSHGYFVTLVHETLHAVSNPHPSLPNALMEGITQRLAADAARAVGIQTSIDGGNYPAETRAASSMMPALGAVVKQAYFQGDAGLPAAVNRELRHARAWDAVLDLANGNDAAGATLIESLFHFEVTIQVRADGSFDYPDAS